MQGYALRLRESISGIAMLAVLGIFAIYVRNGAHVGAIKLDSVDGTLGTFLLYIVGIALILILFGPLVSSITGPLWSRVRRSDREAVTGYLFISPWLIGFLVFALGPMLFSLYASFCDYHIVDTPVWRGWNRNYGWILTHDDSFPIALKNTFTYVLMKTPVVIVVSLGLALLMNQKVPGIRFFRTIYYMPTVVTGVAAIFLWVWVLYPHGILNSGLGLLHVQQPLWFFDPKWAKPALVVMGLWYVGSPMLVLLAGLNGIPKHLYEAADVEGAGVFRKFWNITIPMLSPTLFFIVLTNIIGAFQVFNSAFVISTSSGVGTAPGDPQQSLLFYEVYLYTKFTSLDMGYACALAWILFVIIMIVTAIQLYLSKKWVYYES